MDRLSAEVWRHNSGANVAQCRDAAKSGVCEAYMHNGYFTSVKEVMHFYNTRDVLHRCKAGDPGQKLTCWPPPENSANVNRKQLGNLGCQTGISTQQIHRSCSPGRQRSSGEGSLFNWSPLPALMFFAVGT
jgi:hypothetical protein